MPRSHSRLRPDIALLDVVLLVIAGGADVLDSLTAEALGTRIVLTIDGLGRSDFDQCGAAHGVIRNKVAPEILVNCVRQIAESYCRSR